MLIYRQPHTTCIAENIVLLCDPSAMSSIQSSMLIDADHAMFLGEVHSYLNAWRKLNCGPKWEVVPRTDRDYDKVYVEGKNLCNETVEVVIRNGLYDNKMSVRMFDDNGEEVYFEPASLKIVAEWLDKTFA